MGVIEETIGFILGFVVLLDVFLLVLYARANKTIISTELSHLMWRAMVWASRFLGRWREFFLTLSGPLILIMVLGSWALLLSIAAALIIHPNLGTGITATQGETPTDFLTALYVGGSSLSFIGASDFAPQDGFFRMFYLLTSLVGVSLVSLIVTYLMQLYENLKQRNALALHVHILSSQTGDAAEVVCRLGPQGQFENGYNDIVEWITAISTVFEAHHFYPILFFFRFREPHYSVSRRSLVCLDTVTLLKSALDDREYGWLKESAAVNDLWTGSLLELQTLLQDLAPNTEVNKPPDSKTRARWGKRYQEAVVRIEKAGIKLATAGEEQYVSLRTQWDIYVTSLAPKLAYDLAEIDTALAKVK